MLQQILHGATQLGLTVNQEQGQKLLQYLELLRKWNKVHNLCANASFMHMVSYHILDSISVAGSINCEQKNVLDVGTGAGLPGIPLAIVVPSCKVNLLDSKIKKITFVQHAINVLGLPNTKAIVSRVDQFFPNAKFDIIISRAFAELTEFVTSTGHLCANDGLIVAMKADPDCFTVGAEVGLGYKIIELKKLNIPGVKTKRSLVISGKAKHV
jgi:16S rRNA (guanine527-N7)-methyltransferase